MGLSEAEELELLELEEQEAMTTQAMPSRPLGLGDVIGSATEIASKMLPWNLAREYTTELAGEKIAEGAGYMGFPKMGAAIGTGVQMAPDILSGFAPASPETGALRSGAEAMGRRALGYNKGMLKRSGMERANQVAGKMLDEGVITAGASPSTMLDRAKDISLASGQRIGETLKSVDQPATTVEALKSAIRKQLSPGRTGGQYDKLQGHVDEIIDTVGAHGTKGQGASPISFESAQELKQTLKGPAKFGKLTDGERAESYRRAYGITRQAIEDGLEQAVKSGLIPEEKAAQFIKDKATYGMSEEAITALKDRLAGEAANNLISLRGAFAGGMGMATGDVSKVMGGIGAWEALRRRGEATGAAVLNSAAKSRGINSFRAALLTELVDRLIVNDKRQ